MAESPASFDVFALSPEGYDIHFQVRGEKVWDTAQQLLQCMQAAGYRPKTGAEAQLPAAAPMLLPAAAPAPVAAAAPAAAPVITQTGICPVHNIGMKPRTANGETWYSHKTAEGWCRGAGEG